MSVTYTLATVDYGPDERYDALYADGRLIKTAEDGRLSAAEVLEAIANSNITVKPAYIDVDHDYDQEHIAGEGWPDALSDVLERAVAR